MKKHILVILFLLLFLGACQSSPTISSNTSLPTSTNDDSITTDQPITENPTSIILESISIDETTLLDSYQINQFRVNQIDLVLNFNHGFQTHIPLDESMIVESLINIDQPGIYTFHVIYMNQQTSFTVELLDALDIIGISIDEGSYNPYALISTFDIGDIMLDVELENEDIINVPITYEMIHQDDVTKLFSEGVHTIQVQYRGFETSFKIAMISEMPENNPLFNLSTEAAVFYEVFDILLENHYKQPSTDMLFEGATQGMIDSLDDRFTLIFDIQSYASFYGGLNENYVGTGILPAIVDDFVIVDKVIENSPADLAGIQVDDIIHSINGNLVTLDNISRLYQSMVGIPAINIDIEIKRLGEEHLLTYTLQTVEIKLDSVYYEIIENNDQKIGLITVTNFASQTDEQFLDVIDMLEAENIDALIIDLRNNGGGYLSSVVNMLQALLLDDGRPFLTMDYLDSVNDYYGQAQEKKPYDIVTLVNERTASASEIFAAAMQEHGNYTIIGQTTYGKGIAQITRSLKADSDLYLHISNSRWLTPLGHWIHFQGGTGGVVPDDIVEKNQFETVSKIYLYHQEMLTYDSVSDDNIPLQIILNGMGYNLRTDGYYDLDTKAAVEEIQSMYGLTITGNVNDSTAIIINQWLDTYQNNNDTPLEFAIQYLSNPS